MKMTINGVRIPGDVNTLSATQINTALGTNGLPKYAAKTMPSKDKLIAELITVIDNIPATPTKAPSTAKRGRKHGETTTDAAAMVKRSNMITALVNRTMTIEEAVERLEADSRLQRFLDRATIEHVYNTGERPARKRKNAENKKANDVANWIESEGKQLVLKPNEYINDDLDIVSDFDGKWGKE